MKQQLLLLVMMLLPMMAMADAVEIDGIFYNLNAETNMAEVTSNPVFYTGELVIPSSVTYHDIAYSVTSIGQEAFLNNKDLAKITIPNSVSTIGISAFNGCSSLVSVIIPEKVTTIPDGVFHGCNSLVSATLPEGIQSIGRYAFYDCRSLTAITLPVGIKAIGGLAFMACSSLVSIIIPEGVTKLETGTFAGCTSLVSVELPNTVTEMECETNYSNVGIFSGCTSLQSISIPSGVTVLDNGLFSSCSSLTTISLPANLTTIGYQTFYGCSSLKILDIPQTVKGIGEQAFRGCSAITSITIPEEISTIENATFSGCHNLTTIHFPQSLKTIGNEAFYKCSNLAAIDIPNSVTSIGESAFAYCQGVKSLSLPEGLQIIKRNTFTSCWQIKEITIPASIEYIYQEAFSGCDFSIITMLAETPPFTYDNTFSQYNAILFVPQESLNTYKSTAAWNKFENIEYKYKSGNMVYGSYGDNTTWSYSLVSNKLSISGTGIMGENKSYGNKLWQEYLNEIKEIEIAEGITTIANYSFANCSSIPSINIPSSVTEIGEWAFAECSNLTELTIPSNVYTIKGMAFYGCEGLTKVIIEDSEKALDLGLSGWNHCFEAPITEVYIGRDLLFPDTQQLFGIELEMVAFGDKVTNIGDGQFTGCSKLSSITLPDGITRIGNRAFTCCQALTTMTIPASVTIIGYDAFRDCGLASLKCLAINPPAADVSTFSNFDIKLKVPKESVSLYKKTIPWSYFIEIKSLEDEDIPTPRCATPTISYTNGSLVFNSETEGVNYISEITDYDIKKNYTQEVQLTATYIISVYATKMGYDNSDVATATLCWIAQEPQTEGITNGVAQIPAKAVLIQSEGGIVKVEGIDDGTPVTIYTPDGKQAGSAVCRNGAALVGTSIQPGNVAIVKIGDKSIKVAVF